MSGCLRVSGSSSELGSWFRLITMVPSRPLPSCESLDLVSKIKIFLISNTLHLAAYLALSHLKDIRLFSPSLLAIRKF